MRAVVFDRFQGPLELREIDDPAVGPGDALVRVRATGVCRSDWHGWMGHDPDIVVPHVPGHELAGDVVAVGERVTRWSAGARVTAPFVCACGTCEQCAAGHHQVCSRQEQPGFTYWGSFADLVVVPVADVNLVALPEQLPYVAAASLGCRFATAFRAVVEQGRVRAGEWVAVQGCGGVGLSAVAVAAACGARVVAVDVAPAALTLAAELGAEVVLDARSCDDVAAAVVDVTAGGAHVSLDALGSPATCVASVLSLRRRGRHVQVGLLPASAGRPQVPMDRVVAYELAVLGSHGMAAHDYPRMLGLVAAGVLRPDALVRRTVTLEQAGEALVGLGTSPQAGITVVVP